MARVSINILGISELTQTGMNEFNSDDYQIYYHGQESFRRNGVALIVNKRIQNAELGCKLKNDSAPEELWTEVGNIVWETVTRTIPEKQKCKKTKWFSKKALQIAEERREAKGKGERERFNQMNAEFKRIARRDKKAFLNEQSKEIEENNRMGKTRDLLKKI